MKRPLTRCENVKGTSKHLVKNLGTINSRKQLPSSNLKGQEEEMCCQARKSRDRDRSQTRPLPELVQRQGAGIRNYSTPPLGTSNAFHWPSPTRSQGRGSWTILPYRYSKAGEWIWELSRPKPHIYVLCRQGLPGSHAKPQLILK